MSSKSKSLRAEDMPPAYVIPQLKLPADAPQHVWRAETLAHHLKYTPMQDHEGRKEFFTRWKHFYPDWKDPQPNLVNWMIKTGRVYFDPGTPVIVEKDGAQVLIYAQDLTKTSRELLKEKMRNAIRFSGPLQNYKALNALMAISDSGGFYPNTMGALFLRLTELTALHTPIDKKTNRVKTFLELCDEHGFELSNGEALDKKALKTKLKEVLKSAGIARLAETKELMQSWVKYNTVSIHKNVQLENEGSYSANANAYLKGYGAKFHDFNKLISASYAIAKETAQHIRKQPKTLQGGMHNYLSLLSCQEPQRLAGLVNRGEEMQMQLLAEKIKADCKGISPKKLSAAGKEFFKKMLNRISYESVAMIAFSGYSIVYAPDQDNITNIYPGKEGEGVLGYDAASCDVTRKGPGVYIPKVKTLIVTDGESRKFWGTNDLYLKLCMTIMHESVHIGLSNPNIIRFLGWSGNVNERGFHEKGMLIADIDDFLRDACAELQTLSLDEQAKYTNWGTLLDTTLKLKEMFSPTTPPIYFYDEKEWKKELICNWHAMSACGGQYAKGAVIDNIFHSSGKDEDEPVQLKTFHTGTLAVRSLIGDVATICMHETQYKIPGITSPLKGLALAA